MTNADKWLTVYLLIRENGVSVKPLNGENIIENIYPIVHECCFTFIFPSQSENFYFNICLLLRIPSGIVRNNIFRLYTQ